MPYTSQQIKGLIGLAGHNQQSFARLIGVRDDELSRTIHRIRRNERVRRLMAEALGMSVTQLFGEDQQEIERGLAA